jgi:hypothetical protein
MATSTIRFRTQDTRASTARKLNVLLEPLGAEHFRHVPQTYEQWQHELNAAVQYLLAQGYPIASNARVFRLGEPRQVWARKLNKLADAIATGAA